MHVFLISFRSAGMIFIIRHRTAIMKIVKMILFCSLILVVTKLALVYNTITTPSTAAFTLIIVVLLAAFFGDLSVAIITSIVATVCYDYFFLPPVGTFNITAFSDWISLVAFLVASVIISRLAASAAENAATVHELNKTMKQFIKYIEWLLATPYDQISLSGIATETSNIFSLEYCSIHVYDEGKWNHFTGIAETSVSKEVNDKLEYYRDHPTQLKDLTNESLLGVRYMQIKKGITPVAVLAIKSNTLSAEAMEAIAYMIGVRLGTIPKE
jgi:two-component system, OmpR family, sensor histidine kinase KdpD